MTKSRRGIVERTPAIHVRQVLSIQRAKQTKTASGVIVASALGQQRHVGCAVTLWEVEGLATFVLANGPLEGQRVTLEARPCRFGGQAWMFRCPETHFLCASLYLVQGRFTSRTAARLTYASSNASGKDRGMIARLTKATGMSASAIRALLQP